MQTTEYMFRKLEEKQAKLERQLEVERKKLEEEQKKLDDERDAFELERITVAQEATSSREEIYYIYSLSPFNYVNHRKCCLYCQNQNIC